ncbi:hypothetical protein [Aeromonas sp. NJAU223]|uniref:hypothetical protein n=1 Tax=Aeromonas sp. NJAU223 TaxID=3115650 RepID=UPI003DA83E01
MTHQTLTVENSRIRVTVSREIADKFLPTGVTGRDESPGQAQRGRLLSAAMGKLASATELRLRLTNDIERADIIALAHKILVRDYLEEHSHYNVNEVIMRLEEGHLMHKYMAQEVTLANAHARGVLKPISQDDARFYVASRVMAGVLSSHECRQLETRVELLLSRIGIDATEALDKARHAVQAQANIAHHYHMCRANLAGWEIKVIGELPTHVGLSKLLPRDD